MTWMRHTGDNKQTALPDTTEHVRKGKEEKAESDQPGAFWEMITPGDAP
jgi:hypothetical protein